MMETPDEPTLISALATIADAVRRGSDTTEPDLSVALGMFDELPVSSIATSFRLIERKARVMAGSLPVHYFPRIIPGQAPRYADAIRREPNLCHLLLFHPDGRARQAALEAFVEPPKTAFVLALIFPRLNDWVPVVRDSAVACLNRIIPLCDRAMVFDAVRPMILRSGNWARWNGHASTLMLDTLEQPSIVPHLVGFLKTNRGGAMSNFMRTVLARPLIDEQLYNLFKNAASPAVRARALRVLIDGHADLQEIERLRTRWDIPDPPRQWKTRELSVASPPLEHLMAQGLSDKSATVRKVIGRMVVARAAELSNLNEIIDRLLADPLPTLRWRGDFLNRTMRK